MSTFSIRKTLFHTTLIATGLAVGLGLSTIGVGLRRMPTQQCQ